MATKPKNLTPSPAKPTKVVATPDTRLSDRCAAIEERLDRIEVALRGEGTYQREPKTAD